MLAVVTGVGPRVGSSFIMRQAKVAGLNIHGTKYLHGTQPVTGNPGGYYDLLDEEVLAAKSGVAKVWGRQMPFLRTIPDKILVLERRDREAWLESITKQIKREGLESRLTAPETLEKTGSMLSAQLLDFPGEIMRVYTEDLDNKLQDILTFIGDN